MFGTLRRVSRFATAVELAEPLEVLRAGGIVGLPSSSGFLVVGSERATPLVERVCGNPAAMVVASADVLAQAGLVPRRLVRWFSKFIAAGVGEVIVASNPMGPGSEPRSGRRRKGFLALFSRDDGSENEVRDRFSDDDRVHVPRKIYRGEAVERGHATPTSLGAGFAVKLADTPLLRTLCEHFEGTLMAAVPKGAGLDGAPMTPGDAVKRFRDGINLILSPSRPEAVMPLRQAALMQYGVAVRPELDREKREIACQPHRPLFVCIGNINRSAYAHAYLRALVERESAVAKAAGWDYCPAWDPASSGISAVPESPATEGMLQAAGFSICQRQLSEHQARRFTPLLAQGYDEIFPLDSGVAKIVRELSTPGVPVTFHKDQDLPDPMGLGERDYLLAAELIEQYVVSEFQMRGVSLDATPGRKASEGRYEDRDRM